MGVGFAAVADAALLQGLTVAAFLTLVVFTYYSRRPEQGWAR